MPARAGAPSWAAPSFLRHCEESGSGRSPQAAAAPWRCPFLSGLLGRLRDAVPGPCGSLWLLTNNTDGHGSPGDGDDKLVEVRLDVSRAG